MGSILFELMSFIQVMVPIFLLLLICTIIFLNIKEIKEWRQANKLPILTINAIAVKKRFQVIHHFHQFEIHLYYPTSIFYFVTFVIENGERLELEMSKMEYEQISEGDEGKLTLQGRIFHQFSNQKEE